MRSLAALPLLVLTACGGAEPPPASPDTPAEPSPSSSPAPTAAPAPAPAAKKEADSSSVPTTCDTRGNVCVPSPGFVKKLCGGVHPDVALAFFRKGTPFSRAYLSRNVEAWNASGGASSADKLVFDEEVIVLLVRENNTGIQVSGSSGGFDVLRWDGTCATLSGEELSFNAPPKAKSAKILWKDLSEATQNALLGDAGIEKLNKERRTECKGATIGEVSTKCVKAVDKLSEAVIAYVRGGGEVPAPARID